MSYELERDNSSEIPRVPESWMERPSRIYEILPDDPVYVSHNSIVRDTNNGEIGIDTNDRLPDVSAGVRFSYPEPIAIMRILFSDRIGPDTKYEDGYIVDLRYKLKLEQRDLGFHDDDYSDDDQNRYNKTLPILGAIVRIDENKFVFRSRRATLLYEHAQSLIEFVDADRISREMPVYEDKEVHEESIEAEEPEIITSVRPAPGPIRRFMKLFYDTNSGQTE